MTVFSVAMVPLKLGEVISVSQVYAALEGLAFALQLAAMAMLFRADAKIWLGRKGDLRTDAGSSA